MILSYRVSDKRLKPTLDIVDGNDNATGIQIDRDTLNEDELRQKNMYVRTVNCFLINKNNKIWTPTRSEHQKFWPNCLDFSCGGYVHSGETYQQALLGGLKKEVNINTEVENLVFLGKLNPIIDQIKSFMEVYKLNIDTEIKYNNNDYSNGEWLDKSELIEKLQNNTPAKVDLLSVLLKFQGSI